MRTAYQSSLTTTRVLINSSTRIQAVRLLPSINPWLPTTLAKSAEAFAAIERWYPEYGLEIADWMR